MTLNLKAFGVGLIIGSLIFLVVLSLMTPLTEFNFGVAAVLMTIGLAIMLYAYAKQIRKYGIRVD